MTATYTLNGRSGRSIMAFTIKQPGTYSFHCGYEEGKSGPETVVAVGRFNLNWIFPTLLYFYVPVIGGPLIGTIAFVVIYRMQRRSLTAASRSGLPSHSAS
jgi:hypothetical protein